MYQACRETSLLCFYGLYIKQRRAVLRQFLSTKYCYLQCIGMFFMPFCVFLSQIFFCEEEIMVLKRGIFYAKDAQSECDGRPKFV